MSKSKLQVINTKRPKGIKKNEIFFHVKTGYIVFCPNSNTVCPAATDDFPEDCDYIRFVDTLGKELVYWDQQEWKDDLKGVFSAIFRGVYTPEKCQWNQKGKHDGRQQS